LLEWRFPHYSGDSFGSTVITNFVAARMHRPCVMLAPPIAELRALAAWTGPGSGSSLADLERGQILEVLRATRWVVGGRHGAARGQLPPPCPMILSPSDGRKRKDSKSGAKPIAHVGHQLGSLPVKQ